MSRGGNKLALSALLLALCVCSTSLKAQEPAAPEVPTITDLKKQLDAIQNDLKTLKSLQGLDLAIPRLEKQLNEVMAAVVEIDKMTRANTTRIANAFDPAARAARPSTIRLQNTSAVRATVFLSGTAYDVLPNETRDIKNQPPGFFNYYVAADGFGQISALATRELKANEIYTIYINPR